MLNKIIAWLGWKIFCIKYKLGLAKEGKDFVTADEEPLSDYEVSFRAFIVDAVEFFGKDRVEEQYGCSVEELLGIKDLED